MSHMIELHKVSKFYTNKETVSTGFTKVDLNLDMGEFVAITGESGSGKSTLLNVISGLDSYEEGELYVAGEDTSAFRTEDYERYRKTYIGNIFQDFNLVNSYTVYQNIELSMLLCGIDKEEQKRKIPEYIALVGMEKYTKTKASRLSGGQKQRVAIARALAKNAPIIVADEPTGNLDSASAASVMETLHRIAKDKLVVIVTHNYEQAEPYVTRKITMHDGRIIEDKSIRPANIVTEPWKPIPIVADDDFSAADSSSAALSDAPKTPSAPAETSDSAAAYGYAPGADSASRSGHALGSDSASCLGHASGSDSASGFDFASESSSQPSEASAADGEFGMSDDSREYGSTVTPIRAGGRVARNAARAAEEEKRIGGRAARNAAANHRVAGHKKDASGRWSEAGDGEGSRAGNKKSNQKPDKRSDREANRKSGGRSGASTATASRRTSTRKTGYGSISTGSQIRLGVRNTFNLPAKFILLLVVYVFVAAAVMGQYTSTLQSWHNTYLLGYSGYFTDTSAERIVVTKKDGSSFTTADYDKIQKMDNIDYIVKCDSGIDTGIMFETSNYDISGPMYPVSSLDSDKISIGRMPEKDTEAVIAVDEESYCYDAVKSMGEKILGKKYYIQPYRNSSDRLLKDKVSIVGVVYLDADTDRATNGNTFIYVTDNVAARVLVKSTAMSASVTLNYGGTKEDFNGYQVVYPSSNVPKGEVYISEDQAYQYFDDGNATGKKLGVHVETHYFTDDKTLKISKVFKQSTIKELLGYSKNDYDLYSSNIYISRSDYNTLFNKGNYQSSVYMKDEQQSEATSEALEKAGYKALVLKDTMQGNSAEFTFINKAISIITMAVEFVVLFFIAYAVIRLIMRSRNSYYSTLRILGATKRNTDNILRVELVLMMAISYGLVAGASILARRGIIPAASLSKQLSFLNPLNYLILLAALLLMSLLIANRYSRKIFSKSAMKSYREEV